MGQAFGRVEDAQNCKRGISINFRFSLIKEKLPFNPWHCLGCRFVFLASVCMVLALSAHAGPIVVNQAVGCGKQYTCVSITGPSLNLSAASALAGNRRALHFVNLSGTTLSKLIVTETGLPAVDIECNSNVFTCSVVAFGLDGAKIILTPSRTSTGLLNGHGFEIACGGPCSSQFDISAVAIAEPNDILLLLVGIATTLVGLRLGALEKRFGKR